MSLTLPVTTERVSCRGLGPCSGSAGVRDVFCAEWQGAAGSFTLRQVADLHFRCPLLGEDFHERRQHRADEAREQDNH